MIELRSYQHDMVNHILSTPRCALWSFMGSGKTCATLTALNHLSLVESRPALIIGPLRVARSVWSNEIAKWPHLAGMIASPIIGDEAARKAALKRDVGVYTTNFEQVPWLVEHLGERWPFGTVIADESTRLKSFRGGMRVSTTGKEYLQAQGGMRARALARVAHKHVTRFIELTGTPAPNGLKDLWGAAWMLDAGQRLGRTYDSYVQRWFTKSYDGYSVVPLPFAQEQIQDRLRDICLSLNAKDYFDLNEPIVNNIYVDLPVKARKLYRDMEREMFAQIGEHGVEAFNAASRTMKCLQLANGAIYVGDPELPGEREWREVHDVKISALESVVEEAAGMPVLVAHHFKSDLARLQKAFPKGRVLDTQQDEDDWNAGKIPVMFAHPESAGHGLNLQDGGNIIVFFGHWWDLEKYQQIIERIGPVRQMQSRHDRPVFIHHIIARDTVDEMVMARREGKRTVQDILMEAMRRRAA